MTTETGCVVCKQPKAPGNRHFCAPCQQEQDGVRHRSQIEHVYHTWINQRQDARRAEGLETEMSLYEFKHAYEELTRLPIWLKRARENDLPEMHRQCSYQQPEPIADKRVMCVLGQDVTECPILQSLYASIAKQAEHEYYRDMTPEVADHLAGRTCVWHVFTEKVTAQPWLDTSEGYITDGGSRLYWKNVYDSLAGANRGAL